MFIPIGDRIVDNMKQFKIVLCGKPRFPKTAIMATIGKTSYFPERRINLLNDLIDNGMNMIRINLAHVNSTEERIRVAKLLKDVEKSVLKKKEPVLITVDLAGPKIRIGKIRSQVEGKEVDYIKVKKGEELRLTLNPNYGIKRGSTGGRKRKFRGKKANILIFSLKTKLKDLHLKVKKAIKEKGMQIVSMDDGGLRLEAFKVENSDIICKILNDWKLHEAKGVNFPNCEISGKAVTTKDKDDLDWLFHNKNGIARGKIDYISLSFVKKSGDVKFLKNLLELYGQDHIKVIAKIETAEAVNERYKFSAFKKILKAADGIMIARGDLGAEIPFEDVPEIQRILIEKTHEAGKAVIVATQMLEFMVDHEFATRAEVTDVTNAIREGADVTMLSAETSKGINPALAVQTMDKIAKRALIQAKPIYNKLHEDDGSVANAIAHPAVLLANELDAKLIVSFTHSGKSPIAISSYRPIQPIIAITYNRDAFVRLIPFRGIYPVYINYIPKNSDQHRDICKRILLGHCKIIKKGQSAVVTFSMEPDNEDTRETNSLYVFQA